MGYWSALRRALELNCNLFVTHEPTYFSAHDDYSVDLAICSDDGFTHWHAGALSIDLDIPVIVVNHAVTELPGIRLLAVTLEEQFPDVPVHHIEQACMFELVRS